MKNALENSAKCINYALNLANANQKVSIRKILEELNQCKNSINLNSNANSNEDQNENVDQKIQNANKTQSVQNSQNENDRRKSEIKSSNIEMRIEKTIDEKMRKIQSHLDKKLN